ncbi:hypothetical protein F2Q68_00021489 [Brassica cretica]|uniref:Uncharacterized protein n=1 Tax=Brassica cretica TaxID=69181 RepID=A0A8S9G4E3_BRACR|nr:hypothetical protein F2Q68_00021489 [Brassica cretica]
MFEVLYQLTKLMIVRVTSRLSITWLKIVVDAYLTHPSFVEVAIVTFLFCNMPPKWDPWGVPDDYECEVIENDAPIPKHVPQHRPGPLPEDFYRTLEGLISESKTKIPAASSTDPLLKE